MATETVPTPVENLADDKDVDERFKLPVPPTGALLGSFSSFNLGLAWNVPNVRDTDMLTTAPVYSGIDEKIYYSLDLEDTRFADPTVIELFKVEHCVDVQLRAVNSGEIETPTLKPMDLLTPDQFVFGATIVNSAGEIVIEEKNCRGYMAAGKHYWEIPAFITPAEFSTENLLDADGVLHLRLTFSCKAYFPIIEVFAGIAMNSVATSGSVTNANSEGKVVSDDEKRKMMDAVESSYRYFTQTGMDPFSARLQKLLKTRKFSDGTIIVASEGKPKQTFPIHRAILSAHSKGFEAAFDREPEFTFSKYEVRTIETLLNYIYTGELVCHKSMSHVQDLMEIGEEMGIYGLRDRCSNIILETDRSIEGGINCFRLAEKYNSIPLRLGAMEIFEFHKSKLKEHKEFKKFVEEYKLEELFFPMFE